MRRFAAVLLTMIMGLSLNAQVMDYRGLNEEEAIKMLSLPELKLPASYPLKSLPSQKDNSASEHFPMVFSQDGWSCNQASSVGYLFTYEMNALRNVSAFNSENLYPPSYVWNFLNAGDWETGVSYFDSWEVIRTNGIPSVADYGEYPGPTTWKTGYDIYYKGMMNRSEEVFNIHVGNPQGLLTLKGWINDHLDGSPNGGLANFQIGSGGMKAVQIPEGQEGEGRYLMEYFNWKVGHAMTFVGWNDSVKFDFNGDGLYTNDIDTNEDGKVDMRDWEVGAMLAVNSWGENWPAMMERGRVFVPYRLLALDSWHGGIWAQSVTVMRPKEEYSPKLTIKASVTHTKRNQIKIIAGVAQNFAAAKPDVVLEFPFFNFSGGPVSMQGNSNAGNESLEFGLDITPLLNHIDPNLPAKFFLQVFHHEGEEQNGSGKIDYMSIMDYGSGTVVETAAPETNVGIRIRDITSVSVIYDPVSNPVKISTTSIPEAQVGQGYSHLVQASGGTPPYKWTNMENEYVAEKDDKTWNFPVGEKILGISDTSRLVIDLPFDFEFYGVTYKQVTVLKNGGLVMGAYPKDYPYVIDPRMYIFQNAGIYPFYADLQYLFGTDGVYRVDDIDGMVIAWDATLTRGSQVYDPKFGVKIFPDGRIETGYYTTNISPDWNWIAGVSAGDMKAYTLPDINTESVFLGGYKIIYTMNNWPSWLIFSPGGALLGVAQDGQSRYFLPIKVVDNDGLYSYKTFNLQINGTSSINDLTASNRLEVYPNPFADRLNLKLETVPSGNIMFELFSIDGRKVYAEELKSGSTYYEINLSELENSGSYFYQINVGGEMLRGKVVKR